MNDAEDSADVAQDTERYSRRDRWKDAFSKTKSRLKKEKGSQTQPKADFHLSDDVNEFLAAGRKSADTTAAAAANSTSSRNAEDFGHHQISPRASESDSLRTGGQPSPRGVPVPKLDISQTRWPNSRPIAEGPRSRSDDHLTPEYSVSRAHYERSHSFNSALAKKGSRPRGLSVTFANFPPTIIGEGGDEAEAPTYEIFRAKQQRSRSLSPYLDRPASLVSNNSSNSRSPVRRKPVPSPGHSPRPSLTETPDYTPTTVTISRNREDNIFQPRPVRRVQTGLNEQASQAPHTTKSSQDVQEFEKHLHQAVRPSETSTNVQDLEKHLQEALNLGQIETYRKFDTSPPESVRTQQMRTRPPQPAPSIDQSRNFNDMQSVMVADKRNSWNQGRHISPTSMSSRPERQQRMPPNSYSPYQDRRQHVSPMSSVSSPDPQQRFSPKSPPFHPNLQQSMETSQGMVPPTVPNFYADVNRQDSGSKTEIEKRPFLQHVQELAMNAPPRPPPDHQSQVRRSPGTGIDQSVRISPSAQQQPSSREGWI